MIRRLLASLVLLGTAPLAAQTPGSCDTGSATATLDANDVEATLYTTGTLFYGPGGEHDYYVPKFTGASAVYAANLWVGGRVGGEVRMAAADFAQGSAGHEFWPGPLDEGATLPDPSDCSAYDRIWVVSVQDVAVYEAGGDPTSDLAEWPVGLGAPAVDADGNAVEPTSRDQALDLGAGERPAVYGSQTAFWVMNDVGNEHRTTGSDPLGIEVRVTAFAIASAEAALDQATFYRYHVVNRNREPIEDLRLTWWTDTDLGMVNEWQGVDTTRAMGFTYNPSTPDRFYDIPPATGVDFLDQPLGAYTYRANGDARRGEPQTAVEFDRAQRGLWNDGTPLTTYGSGYNVSTGSSTDGGGTPSGVDLDTTAFAFPGDPVTRSFWSEVNADGEGSENYAGNKRSIPTTRPVDLAPGESVVLTVAFLFAQGGDHLDSVRELQKASDWVQGLFDAGTLLQTAEMLPAPTAAPVLRAPEDGSDVLSERVTFEWAAVPGATTYRLEVASSPGFEDPQTFRVRGTRLVTADLAPSQLNPFYWRVVPQTSGGNGPASEARSFTSYRYAPGALMIDRQTPAYVEVQGPGGVDPCGEASVSTYGCAQVGGNAVLNSLNGTGQYTVQYVYSRWFVPATAEREVEVRWTGLANGSYARTNRYGTEWVRVPFQVWDVGVVPPGAPNDPSDDVRLIPIVSPADEVAGARSECGLGFGTADDGTRRTPQIGAAYPTDPSELASLERDLQRVARSCSPAPPTGAARRLGDLVGDDVFGGVRFVAHDGDLQAGDLAGATVRFYTADPAPTRGSIGGGEPQEASLFAPYPNPASGPVTVAVVVGRPGPVSVRVVDLLGREVARLAEGRDQAAGTHYYSLDTSGWASGVYLVSVHTESGVASRPLTVVR